MKRNGINKWVKPMALMGLIIILAILPLLFSSPYLLHILILTFIYTVGAVSFRTITISGQFPLAHAAFMGIGAYTAAMASHYLTWSPWITIPMGALAAGIIGILFGYPFARLRTLYYAMGSLFFGVAITYIVQSFGITGGYIGLTKIQPLFSSISKVPYYYFFLVLALVCAVALYRFEFSRIGTNLKAIAQSHLLASSVGINEVRYRVLAVAVGCFFVGLVGAAFAHYNGIVTPSTFDLSATLWLAMYVLIGGIASFAGPLIGTPILYFIPQYYFSDLKSYSPYIPAAILIVIAYFMPKGLAGLFCLLKTRYLDRINGRSK
ncbi:MAG: branched-chain amino acid ABC transporter permease [Dehalococcoidales bacterium]